MWWENYDINCESMDEYKFWSDAVLSVKSLKENVGENETLKILSDLSIYTQMGEGERLTAKDILTSIQREWKIKQARRLSRILHKRGVGGRKSKISDFVWRYENAVSEQEKKQIIAEAKRQLSRTSFWRFKKAID